MNILKSVINRRFLCQQKELTVYRTLFTREALGVKTYISNREQTFARIWKPEEFKKEFREQMASNMPLNLHIEYLKNYLHLMSGRSDDVELLWEGLQLYQTLNDQWQTKSELNLKKNFTFGPIVMRALHYHGLPENAIQLFDDRKITHLFDQRITYEIFMDLLYDHKLYNDVLRIYAEVKKRTSERNMYVSSAVNAIVFATYFRLNTPAHDDIAYEMYNELKMRGDHTKQYQKSIALVAAMRLKWRQAEESLEILSIHDDTSVNIRCIRILSYAYLSRFDDVFRLLEMSFTPSIHTNEIIKVPIQLLEKVDKQIQKTKDDALIQRYNSICAKLQRLNATIPNSLANMLCNKFPKKMHTKTPKGNENFGDESF